MQKIRVNVIVRVVKQSTGRGQLVQWPKKGTDVSGLREKEGHVTGHGGQCENSYKMGSETDEWIKKMRYICTVEYYSAIKKNELMSFAATWMQLEIIILSEISQKEKDKYRMISLKCGTSEHRSTKQKQTHRHREQTCGCQGGGGWGRMEWEFGISRCKLLHIGWINNKVLLCSTGNYIFYILR